MKIKYSPAALEDLREINNYISNSLSSPIAAKNITKAIVSSCHRLSDHPNLGISLQLKTGLDTNYRYLICNNHLIFYELKKENIFIVRILDARTDYMRILFF